jgi:hypothetical protein
VRRRTPPGAPELPIGAQATRTERGHITLSDDDAQEIVN